MALEYQQRLNIGFFSLPQVQMQSCRTQIFGDPQLYVQVLKFPFQLRGNRVKELEISSSWGESCYPENEIPRRR